MSDSPSRLEFNALAQRVSKLETGAIVGTGIMPRRIATVLETFGSNFFPNGQDGSKNTGTNTPEAFIKMLKFMNGDSEQGFSCRFYENGSREVATPIAVSKAIPNVRWTPCFAQDSNVEALIEVAEALRRARCLDNVGGANEPNMRRDDGGTELTPIEALTIQQALSNHFRPLNIKVASPSVADQGGDYLAAYWGSLLPAAIAASDLTEGHMYGNSGAPSQDMWRRTTMLTKAGMPINCVIGEYDGGLYNTIKDPQTIAYQTICGLLTAVKHFHVTAFQKFSIFDYTGPGFFMPVGLFNNHDPNDPSPTAKAIRALFKTCLDTSPTRLTFTRTPLDFHMHGLPMAWAGQGAVLSGGGQTLYCQGADNVDYLVYWNEQNALDFTKKWPVTTEFAVAPSMIEDCAITNPLIGEPHVLASWHNAAAVTTSITTEAKILRIHR